MTNPESISTRGLALPQTRPATARPTALVQRITQWLTVAFLALVSYLLISHFFVESVRVVGRSMAPTLADSDQYLLNRWIYYVRAPHCGEIVVVRDPTDSSLAVKRVVAGPGDRVLLRNGKVYLNDVLLQEAYLPPFTPTYNCSAGREETFQCGKDQYFVMGDNRMNSTDSRTYGPVVKSRIQGLIIR